jgi:hypothetical protein
MVGVELSIDLVYHFTMRIQDVLRSERAIMCPPRLDHRRHDGRLPSRAVFDPYGMALRHPLLEGICRPLPGEPEAEFNLLSAADREVGSGNLSRSSQASIT